MSLFSKVSRTSIRNEKVLHDNLAIHSHNLFFFSFWFEKGDQPLEIVPRYISL